MGATINYSLTKIVTMAPRMIRWSDYEATTERGDPCPCPSLEGGSCMRASPLAPTPLSFNSYIMAYGHAHTHVRETPACNQIHPK
jgi:hypothetical protein